jgi:hypothetical protein
MLKEEEKERRNRDIQEQIAAKREQEKADQKAQQAKEKRRADAWIAAARKAKQDAWAWEAKQAAEAKAKKDAEVMRAFKKSEAERTRREAERKAEERRDMKRKEAAFRKKSAPTARWQTLWAVCASPCRVCVATARSSRCPCYIASHAIAEDASAHVCATAHTQLRRSGRRRRQSAGNARSCTRRRSRLPSPKSMRSMSQVS